VRPAPTWADLANALFDRTTAARHSRSRRKPIEPSSSRDDEYRQIKALLKKSKEQSGLVKGATPTKVVAFSFRLPKSMHEALDMEAEDEGVSLNQLVVAKLALHFSKLRGSNTKEWIPTIVQGLRRGAVDPIGMARLRLKIAS